MPVAVKQFAEFETLPAPQGGINAVTGLMEMSPTDALYMYNLVCAQNGPTVRPGWVEWDTNMAGTGGVRSVISSRGVGTGGADFLFAVTANGIYNCTTSSSAPTQVVTFGTQTGLAGYVEWDHFTNLAGDVCLLVCDEVNGYYVFDTATSTWTQITQGFTGQGSTAAAVLTISATTSGTVIVGAELYTFVGTTYTDTGVHVVSAGGAGIWNLSGSPALGAGTNIALVNNSSQILGANPAGFASVRTFNNRVWFVQGGSGNAWFLPVAQMFGIVSQFNYGNRFPHGGNLNNLYIFTYGSYYGTFMYLVAVGDAGDMLAYSGNDPTAAASWTLSGQWYVGDLPAGRRSCTNFGGDLLVLCAQGALPVSSLFFQKNVDDPTLYLTAKIAPAIAFDIAQLSTLRGFQFVPWPSLNALIIVEPVQSGVTPKQFCYNLATKAWSVFQNLSWQCAAYWHGALYAGTPDGRLIKMTGNVDGQLLNGTNSVAITWGALGSFQQGKLKAVMKFVDLIKPFILTDGAVSYQCFVRFDFNLADLMLGSVPFVSNPIASGWDSGVWDSAVWSGAGNQVLSDNLQGASGGPGSFVSIGIVGASNGKTTLAGYNLSMRAAAEMMY